MNFLVNSPKDESYRLVCGLDRDDEDEDVDKDDEDEAGDVFPMQPGS
jgi:hypothetical protein